MINIYAVDIVNIKIMKYAVKQGDNGTKAAAITLLFKKFLENLRSRIFGESRLTGNDRKFDF